MQITERDIEILRWINRMRFATAKQVGIRFGIGIWYTYKRLRKLDVEGYLVHVRPLRDAPGVWLCTEAGARMSGTGLWAPPRKINIATFRHDLIVNDLGIRLEEKGRWVSERELRSGKDYRMKVPDGMLICGDKRIACEVELTRKSQRAIEKNIRFYTKSIEYDEVWYLVNGKAVGDAIQKAVRGIDFIKVMDIPEVLKDEGSAER
jgi:hypothetical protein